MHQDHFYIENGVLFRYAGSETDVTVPHGVTALSRNVFRNCREIKTIRLPDTVTEIGEGAFHSCDSLRLVRYGGSSAQLRAIEIAHGNDALLHAAWIKGTGTKQSA